MAWADLFFKFWSSFSVRATPSATFLSLVQVSLKSFQCYLFQNKFFVQEISLPKT